MTNKERLLVDVKAQIKELNIADSSLLLHIESNEEYFAYSFYESMEWFMKDIEQEKHKHDNVKS